MRSFRNNNKRSRFRSNGEKNFKRNGQNSSFIEGQNFQRKSPGRNNQNANKLIDKYSDLAREALSNGDKILSENYLQHADHFTRILNERESYKRERLSDSNDSLVDETTENSENVSKGESLKSLNDESEIKKIAKSQADIN